MRNERKIFLIYTNQTGNTVNYGKSFQNVQGIGKIQFFYFIGNNNQFGIAILAGLLNNLGDTYLTCSEYACDIRKLPLKAVQGAGFSGSALICNPYTAI